MVSKFAHSRHSSSAASTRTTPRGKILSASFFLGLLVIIGRLFYWQIIQGSSLKAEALDQYQRVITQQGQRGKIFTSDGHLLVGNDVRYHVVGYPYLADRPATETVPLLTPLLLPELKEYRDASESAKQQAIADQLKNTLLDRLGKSDARWVSLFPSVSEDTKNQLLALHLPVLGFEPEATRSYPEASMAAHVVGFLGKDAQGEPIGYFGVEGALNKELSGRSLKTITSADALGFSWLGGQDTHSQPQGRDVVLTIRRDIQHLSETMLEKGLEKYGASAGEIIIMEPSTGKILGMATAPSYDPATYNQYDQSLYKNPALVDLYEPGSVLKTLTVSAGIDTGIITPDTQCTQCDGPRVIDKYTIRTWNNEYHPNISMKDALAKSDNVAMIFVAEQLGVDRLRSYQQNFGLGEAVGIDLQEDQSTPFPDKWGPVELATRSFGQGITVNSLQLVRAVGAIANKGIVMQPRIVEKVIEPSGKEIPVESKQIRQVISAQTAAQVTQMMVYAAQHGEAQWAYSKTHSIAGKTGTSQIPKKDGGGYEEDATIASFIGFAPPDNPRFVMLVRLVRPKTSPWAAETAAPLWYKTAEKLFLLLNIPADL